MQAQSLHYNDRRSAVVEDLPSGAVAARQSTGDRAAKLRVRRLAGEEEHVVDTLRQRFDRTLATDGDIAVRTARKRVDEPVGDPVRGQPIAQVGRRNPR